LMKNSKTNSLSNIFVEYEEKKLNIQMRAR